MFNESLSVETLCFVPSVVPEIPITFNFAHHVENRGHPLKINPRQLVVMTVKL